MALEDQVSNETRVIDGQTMVFCAGVCSHTEPYEVEVGEPDGGSHTEERPPDGYAPVGLLQSAGWVREGDQLVCPNPQCVEEVTGIDADTVRELTVKEEVLTPEQVAEMSSAAFEAEIDDIGELENAQERFQGEEE